MRRMTIRVFRGPGGAVQRRVPLASGRRRRQQVTKPAVDVTCELEVAIGSRGRRSPPPGRSLGPPHATG